MSGCTYGFYYGSGHTVSGTVSGGTYGFYYGSGHHLTSATLNNTNDLYRVSELDAYNTLFSGTTEHSGYDHAARPQWGYVESRDHEQVAGAFRAWCRGGVVNSVSSPVPSGKSLAYQHVCESADYPVFRQERMVVDPRRWVYCHVHLRKDASMAWLPRAQIIDRYADPLVDAGNDPLDEVLMTNSTDTWEEYGISWFNTTSKPRVVLLRIIAKNASGNVYERGFRG